MASRTLTELRQNARRRADMEDSGNFISDAELDQYINDGWYELYDVMVASEPRLFTVATTAFEKIDGSDPYFSLPGDFYRLENLISGTGNQAKVCIRSHKDGRPSELRKLASDTGHPVYAMRWVASDGTFRLYVYPESDGSSLFMEYVPQPVTLDAVMNGVLYLPGPWFEYPELFAAASMLRKEESDVGNHLRRLSDLADKVRDEVKNIDSTRPSSIRDITPRGHGR